ncbi:MAG: multidrug effflux MFS transporter [Rhodospirillaceae bacterium]|nr:multidrug effflux MFS transporter [Rhodospirillaceae bacterium]
MALLTVLVAFAALSIDITIPVLSSFVAHFQVSSAAAQLTLSVFVFGFASAQLVAGPLSDRFGRRPVLIGGCILYVAASVACIFATTIEELIAARFVQALGCCAGPVVGRAVVRDIYGGERAAKVLAYMASVMGFVPGIAPIIGGILVEAFGWRAVFIAMLGFGIAALAGCFLLLRETNLWKDPAAVRPARLAANYLSFLGERRYMAYAVPVGFVYAGMLSFHSLSPFVLIEQFGIRTANYGYWFLGIVLGYVAGTLVSGRLHGRITLNAQMASGLAIIAAAAALLAVLGWMRIDAPAAIIGPMSLYLFGAGFVFPNATAGAISPYQTKAGAASALLGFSQFATGAVIAAGVTRFHHGTQAALVTGVLVCAVLALAVFHLLRPGAKTGTAAAARS